MASCSIGGDSRRVHFPNKFSKAFGQTQIPEVEDTKQDPRKSWSKSYNKYKEKYVKVKEEPFLKGCRKPLRFLFAGFLTISAIGLHIISKVSFHIMIWNINPPLINGTDDQSSMQGVLQYKGENCLDNDCVRRVDEGWVWGVYLLIVAPYIFCLLSSLRRRRLSHDNNWIRNLKKHPKIVSFVGVVEAADTIGVCLMVYEVMTSYDPATASVMYLYIALPMPLFDVCSSCFTAFCKTETANNSYNEKCKNIKSLCLVIPAFVIKTLGFVFLLLYVEGKSTPILVVACLLTGCRYYYNFVPDVSFVCDVEKDRNENRNLLDFVSSIIKLMTSFVTLVLIFAIKHPEAVSALFGTKVWTTKETDLNSLQVGNDPSCADYVPYGIAAVNILSTLLFFKASKAACDIRCQTLGFGIPLTIITPVITVLAVIPTLELKSKPSSLSFGQCDAIFMNWSIDEMADIGPVWWKVALSLIFAVVAHIFLCFHAIKPTKTKRTRIKSLFVLPFYCGVFTDLTMLLNGRKDEYDGSHGVSGTNETETDTTSNGERPKIYACATMWHETPTEMKQLLTSIFRMDKHQLICNTDLKDLQQDSKSPVSNHSRADFNISTHTICLESTSDLVETNKLNAGYAYDFESHIFFDDAFEKPADKADVNPDVNEYVKGLIKIIQAALSSVIGYKYKMTSKRLHKTLSTPYGGRIEWTLPGGTKLVAHLKNKTKIRARKRWSQVMYMYYLMGYLNEFSPEKTDQSKAKNTHILALDGDVDFEPEAVMHLLNRMNKDPRVGAACGRIHPIGSGVMVWYQKFEYAISHWLQKATEHVTGCVLCSPGCFSLFRASALISENVMRTYANEPMEAKHYVQYDQGEDRWLCTLLLKEGHRIDYCAESDALTFAPEGFFDFFKQRRRWSPSTMANILDLLMDSGTVIKKNGDISRLFIWYQIYLFISSIVTPGTIFLLIVGAILVGFKDISPLMALLLNLVPVTLFMLSCIFTKENFQLMFAAILSGVYAIVMLIVMMGLIKTSVDEEFCSSTTIVLCFVASVFVISGAVHPQEAGCLVHGFLFFIAIPAMSMLMFLYSLGNLNNVNWGTREKSTGREHKEKTFLQKLMNCCFRERTKEREHNTQKRDLPMVDTSCQTDDFELTFTESASQSSNTARIEDLTRKISKLNKELEKQKLKTETTQYITELEKELEEKEKKLQQIREKAKPMRIDPLLSRYDLKFKRQVDEKEKHFWEGLIDKFLFPPEDNEEKKKALQEDLLQLRNTVCIIVFLINAIVVTLIYAMTAAEAFNESLVIMLSCSHNRVMSIEPLSLLFTFTFGLLLFIQFVCMLYHRFSTLIHITSQPVDLGSQTDTQKAIDALSNPNALGNSIQNEGTGTNETSVKGVHDNKDLKSVLKYNLNKGIEMNRSQGGKTKLGKSEAQNLEMISKLVSPVRPKTAMPRLQRTKTHIV